MQYEVIPDALNPTGIEECMIPVSNYIMVVDGKVTMFNANGKVKEEIQIKDGKRVQ